MSEQGVPEPQLFAEDVIGYGPPPQRVPHLLGGRCPACEVSSFPWTPRCRHCDAELARTSLGSTGTIYSATLVRTRPPLGLPRPYAVAYVDLDAAPLRVFMPIDATGGAPLPIGQRVSLAVAELGVDADGHRCLRPIFRPIAA